MNLNLDSKLNTMLWDLPEPLRHEMSQKVKSNSVETLTNDDQLLIKVLGSFGWYDLLKLAGKNNLVFLLTDSTIQKLFPA